MLEVGQIALLFGVALVAGTVDAIAGGGGMLTVPALLSCGLPPQVALGTNKLQSTFGSGGAAWYFLRTRRVDWAGCRLGVTLTAAGALAGAAAVQLIAPDSLRRLIPAALLLVVAFLLLRPKFGEARGEARMNPRTFDWLFGLCIGFYDGFLGPGTGTFWAMALVALRGHDLVDATARTKVMNFASNAASLALFACAGHLHVATGLTMGCGQWLGSQLGSRLALRRGQRFIRLVMLAVAAALAVKLLRDGIQR